MPENRQSIRVNKSLVVSYRIKNQYIGSGSRSKNISIIGICLPSFQNLEPRVILELEISLGEDKKPIKTIGEVMWVRRQDNEQFPFEVGIKFVKMDDSTRNKIIDFIAKESNTEIKWID